MRSITLISVVLLVPLALMGCGGGGEPGPSQVEQRGAVITAAPTLEQLRADCAVLGKPVPEFVTEPAQIGTAAVMPVLTLTNWTNLESVPTGRVSWYECNLTNVNYPTDVSLDAYSGDPDLFVFSPMRWSGNRLQLVGYDVRTGDGQVGSFYPRNWGGAGRFVAAVYGYGSNNRYWIRFW